MECWSIGLSSTHHSVTPSFHSLHAGRPYFVMELVRGIKIAFGITRKRKGDPCRGLRLARAGGPLAVLIFLLQASQLWSRRMAGFSPTRWTSSPCRPNRLRARSRPQSREWLLQPIRSGGGGSSCRMPRQGVFVDNVDGVRPEPGTVVRGFRDHPSGSICSNRHGSDRAASRARAVATRKAVPIERLMSGAEDSQRIEITGVVRDARIEGERLVSRPGLRRIPVPGLRACAEGEGTALPCSSPGCSVRGTAAEAHNPSLRHLIAVHSARAQPGRLRRRSAGGSQSLRGNQSCRSTAWPNTGVTIP